jgi:hypothetical protein
LREDGRFEEWKKQPNSWLWLYGIPGCGKTVLNASAVRDLREQYDSLAGHAVIHFYFDFNSQRNSVIDMLRSLLLQLTDKSDAIIHPAIQKLFSSKCRDGTREPRVEDLMMALKEILSSHASGAIFILLDALDESTSDGEDELVETLEQMHEWNLECAHVLITSRREGWLIEAFENIVPLEHQMEIEAGNIDNDIKTWLEGQLREGRLGKRIRKWSDPAGFREMIVAGLMNKASGMYDTLLSLRLVHLADLHIGSYSRNFSSVSLSCVRMKTILVKHLASCLKHYMRRSIAYNSESENKVDNTRRKYSPGSHSHGVHSVSRK